MKDILIRWCNTGQLSLEDAGNLITEYLSYTNRNISAEDLQKILQVSQGFVPINWDLITNTIAEHNNWSILLVHSAPDQNDNRRLLCRKFYE